MVDACGYLETMRLLPRSEGLRSLQEKSPEEQERAQGLSVAIVLTALGFMYSVHNLIAPNMTAIAKLFHFNAYERDAYIGGELTLFFYFPGVFGALLAGIISGVLERRLLLALLCVLTSVTCLLTARVLTFTGLLVARATTGFAIGGSLPVVYSLVGDWFPASRRASATAFVTAASGAGVFVGQCVATLVGSFDWRLPFVVVALPTAAASVIMWKYAEEPVRGGQEAGVEALNMYQNTGSTYVPMFSSRQVRFLMENRTNFLVIIQAFPGNIPWGVIIVYIHDFLVQDLRMSMQSSLGAITTLAGAAFAGVITGGFIGESLYKRSIKQIAIFGGVCNILRALPFFIIFGWADFFGPLDKTSEMNFFALLMVGGFMATTASPCTGAMLLNVNLPETRGSVMAMYSVLDDLSKGFGTLFVSMIVRMVGGRAVAYQLSLLLWVVTGLALLYTVNTYEEDEQQMRKNLDEAAMEAMVLLSKQRAQQAIRDRAQAAGEAHLRHKRGESSASSASTAGMAQRSNSSMTFLRWPTLEGAKELLHSAAGMQGMEAGCSQQEGSGCGRGSEKDAGQEPNPKPAPQPASFGGTAGRSRQDRERLSRAVRAAAEAMAAARTPATVRQAQEEA